MQQHGPWQIVQSQAVYRDSWISVRVDDVIRPDGKPGTHSVIHIKAGAMVLAVDSERHVYLTEEFHYGVGRVTLEGVSGGNDPPETFLDTARRELREELGIAAERWSELGVVDPFTSNVVSPTRLFLAEELRFVGREPEGTEHIRSVRVPLAEAVAMVGDGRITHAPTCVAILKVWMREAASG
jgi:8-oxo-dGTP pyrophosphatase MutT (NUDIX family)